MASFMKEYFAFTSDTECPKLYHRWCAMSGVAALLGRQFYLEHGHFLIYPNMYIMLMGNPGTRKSTAIKIMKSLLQDVGYERISADKSSKEMFLQDLHDGISKELYKQTEGFSQDTYIPKAMRPGQDIMDNTFEEDTTTPREIYVAADEFNAFIGRSNFDFIDLLALLWDYSGTYVGRVKNSRSVMIPDPTINILGGNTASNFAKAFPPEVVEQGFLSRLLTIHGRPTGVKITFPVSPSKENRREIQAKLASITHKVRGSATLTPEASKILDELYKQWQPMDDSRFEYYNTRRFTHLIKVCLIIAAMDESTEIGAATVIEANTVLTFTENLMPQAIGEYGKAKNADSANKIMEALGKTTTPLGILDLWEVVSTDLDKMEELANILQSLKQSGKIQTVHNPVSGKPGFLPVKKPATMKHRYFDQKYLLQEEMDNV